MTCACCHQESDALIVWQSAVREWPWDKEATQAVKLLLCPQCSEQVTIKGPVQHYVYRNVTLDSL